MSIEAIKDAGAFTVGKSDTWHHVHNIKGVRVSALCGAYGFADYFNTYPEIWPAGAQDYSTRPAMWSSGYEGTECPTCAARYKA